MPAPNLFILGAQKAGTTYLARVLSDHPDVYFSSPKETMFFNVKREIKEADYRDYCTRFFADSGEEVWRAEGSTTYLQWKNARERILSFVSGRPRYIVCLRQPCAKAVSFFIHNWRRNRYNPGASITDTLELGIELSPLLTSLYADPIASWLGSVPRDDMLFMKFDELTMNPSAFVKRATDFLGIREMTSVTSDQVNAGLPLIWEDGYLTVRADAAKEHTRPRFSLSELEALQTRFTDDLKRTESLTGLDLSNWYALPRFAADQPANAASKD